MCPPYMLQTPCGYLVLPSHTSLCAHWLPDLDIIISPPPQYLIGCPSYLLLKEISPSCLLPSEWWCPQEYSVSCSTHYASLLLPTPLREPQLSISTMSSSPFLSNVHLVLCALCCFIIHAYISCLLHAFSLVLAEVLVESNPQIKSHSILILYKDHLQPGPHSQTQPVISSQHSLSHCLCSFISHYLIYQWLLLTLSCSLMFYKSFQCRPHLLSLLVLLLAQWLPLNRFWKKKCLSVCQDELTVPSTM